MTDTPATPQSPSVLVIGRAALDAHSAADVRDQVTAVLHAEGADRVLVDLSGVTFVDSTGLAVLINARAIADERGVQLILRRPQSQLLRLMSITSTYSLFTWDDGRRPAE